MEKYLLTLFLLSCLIFLIELVCFSYSACLFLLFSLLVSLIQLVSFSYSACLLLLFRLFASLVLLVCFYYSACLFLLFRLFASLVQLVCFACSACEIFEFRSSDNHSGCLLNYCLINTIFLGNFTNFLFLTIFMQLPSPCFRI